MENKSKFLRDEEAIKKITDVLKAYDPNCNYGDFAVMGKVPDAMLIRFEWTSKDDCWNYGCASIVYYPSDEYIIISADWQSSQPLFISEVEDYEWIGQDGKPCVFLEGMPREIW